MTYEFPPPDMKEGCEAFIMDWERVIERALITRHDNKGVENYVCHQKSKACYNVDLKDVPRTDDQIFVDGQPVPIKDGKANLGAQSEEL